MTKPIVIVFSNTRKRQGSIPDSSYHLPKPDLPRKPEPEKPEPEKTEPETPAVIVIPW